MPMGETPGDVLRDAFSRLAAVNTEKLSAIRFLVFVCGGCPVTDFLVLGLRTLVELSTTEAHGTQIVEEGAGPIASSGKDPVQARVVSKHDEK